MAGPELNVVTGAFGYTGKYITQRLLAMGKQVRTRTLTGHPRGASPFGEQVDVAPFTFDEPSRLAESIRGATTLYNTYWIRFPRGQVTFEKAAENSRALIQAAREAGVRRFVHISIANASDSSPLPYFRGKGQVEQSLVQSGLSYAILRPTVVFGPEDVLINNIAWLLRRFPIFAIPGSGDYRLQPVFVEDLAAMAVSAGHRHESFTIDAVGPETYTFGELVATIARAIQSRARVAHLNPSLMPVLARMMSALVRDVILTRDEVLGLMSNLLVSAGPPTGETRFSQWLEANASTLGMRYASELRRHYL